MEHFIEDLPTGEVFGSADPDVGGVDSTERGEAAFLCRRAEDGGVAHVMFDECGDLFFAGGRVEGLGGALSDIANAIEFCAEATVPERMQRCHFARSCAAVQFLWKNGKCTANASKSAILGKAAKLNRAFAGTGNFVNGMRNLRIADVGLIGGIEENDGIVCEGVFDPSRELGARGGGACGVVRVAEINEIHFFVRNLRHEAVLCIAWQIDQTAVEAVFIGIAGVSSHDIGIHIDGINWVHHGNAIVITKNIQDISAVAFGSIGNKNFVIRDLKTARAVVVFRDGVSQKLIPLLGPVSPEAAALAHFIDGLVHGLANGGRKGLGHIADAATDESGRAFGIGVGEGFDAAIDLGKKVTGFEFKVV